MHRQDINNTVVIDLGDIINGNSGETQKSLLLQLISDEIGKTDKQLDAHEFIVHLKCQRNIFLIQGEFENILIKKSMYKNAYIFNYRIDDAGNPTLNLHFIFAKLGINIPIDLNLFPDQKNSLAKIIIEKRNQTVISETLPIIDQANIHDIVDKLKDCILSIPNHNSINNILHRNIYWVNFNDKKYNVTLTHNLLVFDGVSKKGGFEFYVYDPVSIASAKATIYKILTRLYIAAVKEGVVIYNVNKALPLALKMERHRESMDFYRDMLTRNDIISSVVKFKENSNCYLQIVKLNLYAFRIVINREEYYINNKTKLEYYSADSYQLMDYLPGEDLSEYYSDVCKENKTISTPKLIDLACHITYTIYRLFHQYNIVHRDIKLANFIVKFDKNGWVELFSMIDLDDVILVDDKNFNTIKICGTRGYTDRKPEDSYQSTLQVLQSDVYAAGMCLFKLLTLKDIQYTIDGKNDEEQINSALAALKKEILFDGDSVLEEFITIVSSMITLNLNNRIAMKQAYKQFNELRRKYEKLYDCSIGHNAKNKSSNKKFISSLSFPNFINLNNISLFHSNSMPQPSLTTSRSITAEKSSLSSTLPTPKSGNIFTPKKEKSASMLPSLSAKSSGNSPLMGTPHTVFSSMKESKETKTIPTAHSMSHLPLTSWSRAFTPYFSSSSSSSSASSPVHLPVLLPPSPSLPSSPHSPISSPNSSSSSTTTSVSSSPPTIVDKIEEEQKELFEEPLDNTVRPKI